jgi:phosphoenolpyruvate carboxykinase (GTP)
VNWFRADKNGKFFWPGFGDNLRVLEWILDRCNNTAGAVKTPIGYIPKTNEIDMTGLHLPKGQMEGLFSLSRKEWREELKSVKEFFETFGNGLPEELWQEYKALKKRLGST